VNFPVRTAADHLLPALPLSLALATHDQAQVFHLCTYLCVLKMGNLTDLERHFSALSVALSPSPL
jgi:ABC-type polysaccharide/polyol phosphate transport system ATPase subunit